MKAVAEVESADQFCHHLCPNPACGHVFPDVPRKDWPTAAEQCCPECASARFKHVAGRLVPQKRCDHACYTCPSAASSNVFHSFGWFSGRTSYCSCVDADACEQ